MVTTSACWSCLALNSCQRRHGERQIWNALSDYHQFLPKLWGKRETVYSCPFCKDECPKAHRMQHYSFVWVRQHVQARGRRRAAKKSWQKCRNVKSWKRWKIRMKARMPVSTERPTTRFCRFSPFESIPLVILWIELVVFKLVYWSMPVLYHK